MKSKMELNQRTQKHFISYIQKEQGITLVALIITIIVIVIISAVSIAVIYKTRIVEYAINGTMDYTKEGINENKVLGETEKLIESVLNNFKGLGGESEPIEPGKTIEELRKEYKELEEKFIKYKETVTAALNKNGIDINANDSLDKYKEELNKLPGKNYSDGATAEFIKLSEGNSSRYANQINCTGINNYKRLTRENFFIINRSMSYTKTNDKEDILTMSKGYNQEAGILSLGKQKSYGGSWTFWNTFDVYVFVDTKTQEISASTITAASIENESLERITAEAKKIARGL